ncbi:uncharacterized protein GGS25DRAFT_509626 [Hypoxylon fragiforme]|uniref:uncharacterized protein n=1 Tax=Hypoxylon fragiforme TaxID=63214 RepID=UPI0020C6B7A8|nr:uncharacterized protein GGS25DRAFT_509626 [Hypoxylon fragiforme]KAI2603011.1 hypothetical protein GGS25DRAFT_509626 [Hypoxylon fragiforme]
MAKVADFHGWFTPLVLTLILLSFTQSIAAQDTSSTVSVYLPAIRSAQWSQLRGSIVTSDNEETVYTIFCAPEQTSTPGDRFASCSVGDDRLPFTFTEGPSTLHYDHEDSSLYVLNHPPPFSNPHITPRLQRKKRKKRPPQESQANNQTDKQLPTYLPTYLPWEQ